MAKQPHDHGDKLAHQADADGHVPVNPEPLSDGDDNLCGHLCHGHSSSITGEFSEFALVESSPCYALNSAALSSRSQAPPTPPPNV